MNYGDAYNLSHKAISLINVGRLLDVRQQATDLKNKEYVHTYVREYRLDVSYTLESTEFTDCN